ncbi:MAG: DUF4340 domain-containing protein [Cyanobacteria bacterium J06553_1]
MLKRGTLVLLMSAIALGGGVLLLEHVKGRALKDAATANSSVEGDGERLFPMAEEDIKQLVINRESDTLSFTKDEAGNWKMTQPEAGLAEGGAIAFLLNQLTSPAVKTLTLTSPNELADFGLAGETIAVELTTSEQTTYVLTIGDGDFSGDKRYVMAVPQKNDNTETESATDASEPLRVHVVSGSIVNAVERPAEEWLVSESAEESDPQEQNKPVNDESDKETTNSPTKETP